MGAPTPRVHQLVSWLPDSRSVAYNQLKAPTKGEPESEAYLDSRVMWLKVGAKPAQANNDVSTTWHRVCHGRCRRAVRSRLGGAFTGPV